MSTYDSYLVREEDGSSRFTLEDGTGSLLLETAVALPDGKPAGGFPSYVHVIRDDDDAVAFVLTIL